MIWIRSLFDGLIVSVLICGWISIILKVNPRYEMKSFPPEIVNQVDKQTLDEKKGFLKLALPMLLIIILYIIFSCIVTYSNLEISNKIIFSHIFIVFMVWNTIDLVIFDWIVFCKINPDFMILPGTKGNPAYKDYMYHFKGFLKGTVLSLIASTILTFLVIFIDIFIKSM